MQVALIKERNTYLDSELNTASPKVKASDSSPQAVLILPTTYSLSSSLSAALPMQAHS